METTTTSTDDESVNGKNGHHHHRRRDLRRNKIKRRTGRRRERDEPTTREKLTGLVLLFFSGLYLLFLCSVQNSLDTLELAAKGNFPIPKLMRLGRQTWEQTKQRAQVVEARAKQAVLARAAAARNVVFQKETNEEEPLLELPVGKKFLIFDQNLGGQGQGNIMAGLLATHLLGLEFDRIVCLQADWDVFHRVFESVDAQAIQYCPAALQAWNRDLATSNNEPPKYKALHMLTYEAAPNECILQQILQSNDEIILNLSCNTYPRWPVVPENFFFRYYQAKPALLNMLSYDAQHPPHTVVHLRQPDSTGMDPRKGLDAAALNALQALLPSSDTFLVTNRVEWYDSFNWRHPAWREVVHSAMHLSWGVRGQKFGGMEENKKDDGGDNNSDENKGHAAAAVMYMDTQLPLDPDQQSLQLWADWYTILTAKMVYHTHSDFSVSAIHWQNIRSKVIGDVNKHDGQLELTDESWRVDGETARLLDRRVGAADTSELRACDAASPVISNDGGDEEYDVPLDDPRAF